MSITTNQLQLNKTRVKWNACTGSKINVLGATLTVINAARNGVCFQDGSTASYEFLWFNKAIFVNN